MEGKLIVGVVSIVIGIILVGSMLAPAIQMVSGGAWDETVTTTYNEDPDLQFDKQTSDFVLNMSVTIGDDVVITNGEDTVTVPYGAMFLLAADNSAVFISVADDLIFTWSDNDGKHSLTLAGDFTAVIADDKLTINDGTAHDAPLPASYLYVPSSTGGYGSFASGDLAKRAADPVIAAGSFAEAVAYNSSVTFVGDNMIMSVDGTDTLITSAEWVAAPDAEPAVVPFDPSSITIQPLDPGVISLDPEPDVSIMSVPTPSYTDGDWGYNLSGGNAIIVSYSGSGGSIVIPSTVGGYTVKEVGKGNGSNVFDTALQITDLTISEGIETINKDAFRGCTFSGELSLPSTLTSIGDSAFYNCKFTGSLVLPENLTSIGVQAFRQCSEFEGPLILPGNVTSIGNQAFWYFGSNSSGIGVAVLPDSITTIGTNIFMYMSLESLITSVNDTATVDASAFSPLTVPIKEVLNIGTLELAPSSYGLSADVIIQDYIGADCYIAPATLTEVIHHSGGGGEYSGFYDIILVVTVVAILVAAAGLMIYRRSL